MKVEDLVLIAGVAGLVFIAAGFFSRRAQAAGSSAPVKSGVRPLQTPSVYTSGGGWQPDGRYDPYLLNRQYAEEWGYGD